MNTQLPKKPSYRKKVFGITLSLVLRDGAQTLMDGRGFRSLSGFIEHLIREEMARAKNKPATAKVPDALTYVQMIANGALDKVSKEVAQKAAVAVLAQSKGNQ